MLINDSKKIIFISLLLFSSTIISSTSTDSPPDFSIAQIPDTQGFMGKPANCVDPSQITDMYNWIFADNLNNKKNYQYIFHVGDIIGNPSQYNPPSTSSNPVNHSHNDIQKTDQGIFNPQSPQDNAQWAQARGAFNILTTKNVGPTAIPYGFATGNHDYLWPVGHDGYSDYSVVANNVITEVYSFLKLMYSNPANGNTFIDDPLYTQGTLKNVYPSGQYYLISYHEFNGTSKSGKIIPFVALNLPYGLTGSPAGLAAVTKFIQETNALFILNVHTVEAIEYQPGGFYALIANNKKIFMVLYGHDPSPVFQNGTYVPIDGITVARGVTPSYQYRFDYQEGPPYTCVLNKDGPNLPQHPLLRTYEFTIDSPNSGDLSWKVNDVQAWTVNSIYNKDRNPFWTWTTPPSVPVVTPNVKPQALYTIQYDQYLD
ncbi:MAG: hypothetical protein H0U75_02805 [Legionella sp.]|nr:hypothetical protein [Legionella sp.]